MSHDYTDNTRGVRLQKAMAEAGFASRRACEEVIEQGRVTVNGQRISALPAWVDPAQDTIAVDGEALSRTPRSRRGKEHTSVGKTYLIVNKPRGVISTNDDPEGRKRVIDLIDDPRLAHKRLYPVGRLDADSTGMILLTDDGELTHRLTHPSYEATKEYRVTVKGKVSVDDLEKLRKGIYLASPGEIAQAKSAKSALSAGSTESTSTWSVDSSATTQPGTRPSEEAKHRGQGAAPQGDQPTPKPKPRPRSEAKKATVDAVRILRVETDRTRGDRTMLAIVLHEGQNREIRRVLARLGFKVRKLKRVAIGPVALKTLRSGSWRSLTVPEVRKLRRTVGLK